MKMTDLQARLEIEERAKTAAEERAQLAYDQGYRYGVQTTEVRAFAKNLPLLMAMPMYPTLQQVQGSELSQQPMHGHGLNGLMPHDASHKRETQYSDLQNALPSFEQVTTSEATALVSQTEGVQHSPTQTSAGFAASQPIESDLDTHELAAGHQQPHVSLPAEAQFQSLRQRALASTAAFRDRDRQAADEWLEQNAHILETNRSIAATPHVTGKKRKHAEEGEGAKQEDDTESDASQMQ